MIGYGHPSQRAHLHAQGSQDGHDCELVRPCEHREAVGHRVGQQPTGAQQDAQAPEQACSKEGGGRRGLTICDAALAVFITQNL